MNVNSSLNPTTGSDRTKPPTDKLPESKARVPAEAPHSDTYKVPHFKTARRAQTLPGSADFAIITAPRTSQASRVQTTSETIGLRDLLKKSPARAEHLLEFFVSNVNEKFGCSSSCVHREEELLRSAPDIKDAGMYELANYEIWIKLVNGEPVAGYSTFIFKAETQQGIVNCSGANYFFTASAHESNGYGGQLYRETMQKLYKQHDTQFHLGESRAELLGYWIKNGRSVVDCCWIQPNSCTKPEFLTITSVPSLAQPVDLNSLPTDFVKGAWNVFMNPLFFPPRCQAEIPAARNSMHSQEKLADTKEVALFHFNPAAY